MLATHHYQVYTEALNLSAIAQIIGEYFKAFTITEADGFWQGTPEKSIRIDVISDAPEALGWLTEAAGRIGTLNGQDEIIILSTKCGLTTLKREESYERKPNVG